ncbi:MAG: hypothetical protein E4G98_01340, partial [Promethearchaeota archaeon]
MQIKKIALGLMLWTLTMSSMSPMWTNAVAVDAEDHPLVSYSTYLGGSEMDSINSLLIDAFGNIIVIGATFSEDFPTLDGFQPEYGGGVRANMHDFGGDGFIAKFNQTGSLLWSSFLGGSDLEKINAAVLDAENNIIVCGDTSSLDFPITQDALENTKFSSEDAGFVAKIASNGSLTYASFLGGTGQDFLQSCDIDSDGNLYFTGMTASVDFPVTSDAAQAEISGETDAFLLKFSEDLKSIIYCSYLGGSSGELGGQLKIDQNEDVILSGLTFSTNFPLLGELDTKSTSTYRDIYISKFDGNNLTDLQFSTILATNNNEDPFGMTTDASNNIILTGRSFATNYPVHDPFQTTFGGEADGFLTKIDPFNAEFSFSSYFGGTEWDSFFDIEILPDNEIYMCGFGSGDFPLRNPFQRECQGSADIVLAKFSSEGELELSSFFGGSDYDHCTSIEIVGNNLYLAGFTQSNDFNVTSDAYQTTRNSDYEGFITIFDMWELNR